MASETSDQKRKLELTVAALQDRWGVQAVRRLGQEPGLPVPHVPTGFPPLDEALIIGGLPRGRMSEIVGAPTSGMATIALKLIANAQGQAGTAVYLDLGHTFDPHYAARCGLALSRLVLVRPHETRQGLAILQDFVIAGGLDILVFDTPYSLWADRESAQAFSVILGRLIAPLSQTSCVLLFLTSLPAGKPIPENKSGRASQRASQFEASLAHYPEGATLPHFAAIRLHIQRERWLYRQRDIRGYQAQVVVIKNKLGPSGQQASIAITFNGTVDHRED